MAVSEFVWQRWTVILVVSAVASLVALVLYGVDKAASRRSSRRVPENTLHLFSLLGGWPGALVAQRAFRHKTRKLSFQIVFWGTVALHGAVVAWVVSPSVGRFLKQLFENENATPGPPTVTPVHAGSGSNVAV